MIRHLLEAAERELARLEREASTPARGPIAYMIPRFAEDYRALVADLAQTLTNVSVPRARAEIRKLVGELRVETTEEAIELWSTQTAEQALMRVAGGRQRINLVAGAGFVRSRHASLRMRA